MWWLLAGCPGPGVDVEAPALPNVLMISIDTLRRDHVVEEHMPFLASRIASGLQATDFQQCSNWTYASVTCTVTGSTPLELGWAAHLERAYQVALPESADTLAEALQDEGYDTVLISSNGWLSAQWDSDQGYRVWKRGLETPPLTVELGLQQLAGTAPWFLHLHFIEPHAPYDPPDAYLGGLADLPPVSVDLTGPALYDTLEAWGDYPPEEQDAIEAHLRERYRSEVRYFDDQLAEAWDQLEAGGFLDGALVVLWTDHGEQFWERGHSTHAWDLGAEENDAVLALWGLGIDPEVYAGPTHAVDVMPTVLDRLGLPVPGGLLGHPIGSAPDDRLRFTETTGHGGTLQAVTRNDLKLVYDWSGSLQLFDRRVDPAELNDLYDPGHPAVPELWAALWDRALALDVLVPDEAPVAP